MKINSFARQPKWRSKKSNNLNKLNRVNSNLGWPLSNSTVELQVQNRQAAATLVLHTWNQRVMHYPHVNALIPAATISFDGQRWAELTMPDLIAPGSAGHPGNQAELGRQFRQTFVRGIVRLARRGELTLTGASAHLKSSAALSDWLNTISPRGFGVFVEPPPSCQARPETFSNIWPGTIAADRFPIGG